MNTITTNHLNTLPARPFFIVPSCRALELSGISGELLTHPEAERHR